MYDLSQLLSQFVKIKITIWGNGLKGNLSHCVFTSNAGKMTHLKCQWFGVQRFWFFLQNFHWGKLTHLKCQWLFIQRLCPKCSLCDIIWDDLVIFCHGLVVRFEKYCLCWVYCFLFYCFCLIFIKEFKPLSMIHWQGPRQTPWMENVSLSYDQHPFQCNDNNSHHCNLLQKRIITIIIALLLLHIFIIKIVIIIVVIITII